MGRVACQRCNGTDKIWLDGYEAYEYRDKKGSLIAITRASRKIPDFKSFKRKHVSVPGKYILCGCRGKKVKLDS